MSASLTAVFYLVALICFALEATGRGTKKLSLISLGLAFWIFPVFYNTARGAGWF